jgi:transposase
MANHFSGPSACDDGALIQIRFRDLVPENHPVRYIDRFIETIDVNSFQNRYKVGNGLKGRAPKDVRLLLKVILYAIFCRIYSARKIDYATANYADFWFFTHQERISHDKISDFLMVHAEDIHPIFLETISLASRNDLLDFSALYEDGFKIKANASLKRTYNLQSLDKKEQKLSDNLSAALEKLQQPQEDESAREQRDKAQSALAKIASLRDELQNRIQQRSIGKPPSKATVISKSARINMTDTDAEVMTQKDSSHAVSYLKETAVDPKADIVLGSVVSGHDDEIQLSLPLTQQANQNVKDVGCKQSYSTVVTDSRFTSIANCAAFEQENLTLIGPTASYEHSRREPDAKAISFQYNEADNTVKCSEGQTLHYQRTFHNTEENADKNVYNNPEACSKCPRLKDCTKSKEGYRTVKLDTRYPAQQRSLQLYLSEQGQYLYKKRSHVGETYQGDLKQNGRFLRFLRRGITKVQVDSRLHDIVWNLRRIIKAKGANIAWSA